jgi:hypothetical protein
VDVFRALVDVVRDASLVFAAVFGVLAFLRRLEQSKDEAFAQLASRLSAPEPGLRAAAARQLPSFFRYHRYFFYRPYRTQALNLATDALKWRRGEERFEVPREERFVSQALVDALGRMLSWARPRELIRIRLIQADLHRLILQPNRESPVKPTTTRFIFDHTDLTEARIVECGLERASFVYALLWKAKLYKTNLRGADFTEAALWGTDFNGSDLRETRLLTQKVDKDTSFANTDLTDAQISPKIADLCRSKGWDCKAAKLRPEWPRPPVRRFRRAAERVD